MNEDVKVFSSDITRGHKPGQNNLFEMLNVIPARPKPLKRKDNEVETCDFQPKFDKHYTPNKRNKSKVRTVRDIRNLFEKDIYTYLPNDLEKQRSTLLQKITGGTSKDESTKLLAKNILLSGNPITRSSWQMIMNLNPEENANCIQFVLWDGKRIRVNGSKGGKNKFHCNYDLATKKIQKACSAQRKAIYKNKGLLRNSLTVNFKPGPLTRKKSLDNSFQKFNVGSAELRNLPKPALDVQPRYGVILNPSITNLLKECCGQDGYVSEKWAEFSISVLGTVNKREAIQNCSDPVTFELNYKADQRRILMRRDVEDTLNKEHDISNETNLRHSSSDETFNMIENIMNDILDSIEISLRQDQMYSQDEPRELSADSTNTTNNTPHPRDKSKRKNELHRLDVTVIRLPEIPDDESTGTCQKSYCSLGCICASLQCGYKLKKHCGRTECMFGCKCDFSKYKVVDSGYSELIPGLLNLDNEINLRLAKEEQKFHQTVVLTGDKSILLKPERRNVKASKRYADFFSDMYLKSDIKTERILSVVDIKLNCNNIEPWCMVHNLYKCFCKGKFTDYSIPEVQKINETITHQDITESSVHEANKSSTENMGRSERSRMTSKKYSVSECIELVDLVRESTCSRVKPYRGRKFYDSYYISTNRKILEMERNDNKLHTKMMNLIKQSTNECKLQYDEDSSDSNRDSTKSSHSLSDNENTDNLREQCSMDENLSHTNNRVGAYQFSNEASSSEDKPQRGYFESIPKIKVCLPTKEEMTKWLADSYKSYKERMVQGKVKTGLDPPQYGKMAFYPWEFILSRYTDKKNLFLVSKVRPFRIFMAVDIKNPFFGNFINIDEIQFDDLHQYPVSVKNLLTKATELKNNFCVLYGLSYCWEFIGSVTKVAEPLNTEKSSLRFVEPGKNTPLDTIHNQGYMTFSGNSSTISEVMELDLPETKDNPDEQNANLDYSKWFVLTVENDFSEIKFVHRGFFVAYESILRAINVARMSKKIVRLSSRNVDQSSCPQFGIYAIPDDNKYCAFVGPYDKDAPLGIHITKPVCDIRNPKKSQGFWIHSRTLDNAQVIDNPWSFLPQNGVHSSEIIILDAISNTSGNEDSEVSLLTPTDMKTSKSTSKRGEKVIKPIKIPRTNGFYHITPSPSLSVPITLPPNKFLQSQHNLTTKPANTKCLLKTSKPMRNFLREPESLRHLPLLVKIPNNPIMTSGNISVQQPLLNVEYKKPVAEIAPQIKIVGIYSESGAALEYNSVDAKKPEGGMFVLKPEEINNKVMQSQGIHSEDSSVKNILNFSLEQDMTEDIENFLATSTVCSVPNDIYVVSDDDDTSQKVYYKDVYIQSATIKNLGWIRGRRNKENYLSFEFPGFKYTEFYQEEEAFSKINQVLSRKIYVPKTLNLEWHVIESEDELTTKHVLKSEELGVDYVLTKQGLRHKRDFKASKSSLKPNARREFPDPNVIWSLLASSSSQSNPENADSKVSDLMSELEEQSRTLENEGDMLLSEFKKRGDVLKTLCSVSEDQRDQVTETLQNIMLPFNSQYENS